AYSGPADVRSFDLITHVPSSKTIKAKKSPERAELEDLYQNIRNTREGKPNSLTIEQTFAKVKASHANDWLLSVEMAELLHKQGQQALLNEVMLHLDAVKKRRPEIAHLVDGGLELIFEKEKIS